MKKNLLMCLLLLFLIPYQMQLYGDSEIRLAVTGIQFVAAPEKYRSEESFRKAAAESIEHALSRGSADLLVFPEYSAVFFAFFGTNLQSLQGGTIKEGLAFLKDNFGVSGLKDFFLLKSSDVRQAMDRIWGSLAREYGTAILGGSYFAAEGSGKTMELRNRAVLYGSDGTTEYFQDKVFPTPFERDIVEVQPGDIDSAAAVCFQGYTLGFSICRDTFFPVWEEKFADVDLWIDIKANGEIYTPEQAEIFRRALPERLRNLPDTTGMTVCLNGSFLDLLWEGPSSVIRVKDGASGPDIIHIDQARTVRGSDSVRVLVPRG